jgi:F420-dependent oxidoreductase-like protein
MHCRGMKLAANLTYTDAVPLACAAERLGYDTVLMGEGYHSDAPSVLGLIAGRTERIGLTAAVMQIPARPPGLTALTAATLSAISNGRFRLGLGVSNPDVSDGWYGVPFAHPLGRTREYVDIIRQALRGAPLRYAGEHFRLPGPASADTAGNAPLHILTQPADAPVPVYLAAVGSRNLRLAGEIADGWIGVFASPDVVAECVAELRRGRPAASLAGFDVLPTLPTAVSEDIGTAVDALREHYAYLLGIGDPDRNVYCGLACRMGFEREIAAFSERLAAGDRRGTCHAIPGAFIQQTALAGPVPYLAERMAAYAEAGVTTLGIKVTATAAPLEERTRMLRGAADALDRAGVGG